jgi:BlaI family transcriptional regulator, penicillinase repressor
MKIRELTKAEEEVMQLLWKLEKAFVKDIIDNMPRPKPAYNTVSTIIRILERKSFIGHQAFGNTHQYYPLISKEKYTKEYVGSVIKNYFSNSFSDVVSFFTASNNISIKELEEIRNMMDTEIKKKKNLKK